MPGPILPTVPGWVPPLDTGIPSTEQLNDLGSLPKQTFAARNSIIPITYGRDRMFGKIFVAHVDETAGFLYVAYGFCQGEIQGFETVYVDGVDVNDVAEGFLLAANSAVELHTGVAGQATSTILSGAIAGYVDTAPDLAYVVLKVPQDSTQGFPKVEAVIQGRKVFDPRAYNLLVDTRGDPQFLSAAEADEELAKWFTSPTEATSIEASGWTSETADPSPVAATYAELINNADASDDHMSFEVPCDSTKDYTVSLYAKQPQGDRQNYFLVAFYDAAGALINNVSSPVSDATGWGSIGTYHYHSIVNTVIPNPWTKYQFDFGPSVGADATIPTGAVTMRIGGLYCRDGAVGTNTTVRISDHRLFEGLKEVEQVEATVSTWVFTQNPTICFRDMVTNFSGWNVNDQGIIDNAISNDELVVGVKRREIGLTLAKPVTVDSWTKGFRAYMGAFVGWEDGKIRLVPNRPTVEVARGAVFNNTAGSRIDMGDAAELDFGTSSFTVEASFIAPTSTVTNKTIVAKKLQETVLGAGYVVYMNTSGQITARVDDGTNFASMTSTASFDDNTFHHAALVVDQAGNTMDLIIDDVVAATQTSIAAVTLTLSNAQPFRVGALGNAGALFEGTIDEVRVWNDVRTPAELTDNRFSELSVPAGDASLVGYWKLNEQSDASVAIDSSSSGNDGTLAGTTSFGLGDQQIIPDGVAMHIGVNDILKDSLSLSKRSLRSAPNSVVVDYVFASTIATAKWHNERVQTDSARVSSGAESRRLARVSLPGIHNVSQAKRESTERLNWYLTDLEAKVTVFDPGWSLQNGSIVAITHPIGLDAKLFRVRRITSQSGRWTLDLVEYDPAIYSDEVLADPTTPDTNLGSPLNPPTVAGLSIAEELFTYKNGLTGSRIRATWTDSNYPFFSQYLVEGYVDGVLVWQTPVTTNVAISPGVEELVAGVPITYEVRVYLQSSLSQGSPATTTTTVLGKLAVPGDVPSLVLNQTQADTVDLVWGEAVDIDIWRYEIRLGDPATNNTWELATIIELVDGLTYTTTGLAIGAHRFFVKARDSVGNESNLAVSADVTLAVPDPVASLSGFEVASEVRLNWTAVTTGFVERYRIAYDTVAGGSELTLDTVDTLRFQTKDVPEGTFIFKVYSVDKNGIESATAATLEIVVTSDADAFLADSYRFVQNTTATPTIVTNGLLTNMVEWDVRLDDKKYYVTNMGDVFAVTPTDFIDAVPLANYHSVGASEWLSETKDFGLLLTGSWNLTHDVTSLLGSFTVQLEISTDNITYTVFTGLAAKGEFRYARVRINTLASPGTATVFVKSPLMDLNINVVPLEESGEATSSATSGVGKTINLAREYTALKEIVAQPKNKTDALTAIVDNIIVGPNTAVQGDGTNYLDGGNIAAFNFGAAQDFSVEDYTKHSGGTGTKRLVGKQNGSGGAGWSVGLDETNNRITVSVSDGVTAVTHTSATSSVPNDGNHYHVGVSVDRTGDIISIHIDGVLSGGTGSIATVTGSLSNAIAFRTHADGVAGQIFSGLIDEVRVWDDIRSAAEFLANKDTALDMTATQANLIAYWTMDGGVGVSVVTITDETTNAYVLTDTGAGDLTFVDLGNAGNIIQKINSFDVYIFDTFGQQLAEEFQWKWKAV